MPLRHHHLPPHEKEKATSVRALSLGLTGASFITVMLMSIMFMSGLSVNVVLPTSAPIWMGFSTMFFMTLKR